MIITYPEWTQKVELARVQWSSRYTGILQHFPLGQLSKPKYFTDMEKLTLF